MPIRVPKELPAIKVLEKEKIFVMDEDRAMHQDIRPLEILILNLMPKKDETEVQLLRLLSNTPLQINVEFLYMSSHEAKNTSSDHLKRFYYQFQEVKEKFYDGLIITGAPIEQLAFEEVDYWEELQEIFKWCKSHVFSTFHICWGAQAGLYYHHNIDKYLLEQKLTGVYAHDVLAPTWSILKGFDDTFFAPHSRYTGVKRCDVDKTEELEVLVESKEAGLFLIGNKNNRAFYATGHLEYDRETLQKEFERDQLKGIKPRLPQNYYPNDNTKELPQLRWHMAASLLFSNWLNYAVYQNTPYDLSKLLEE
ncbi:homoserine O-succinyltransferase [Enterococcus haemoperoxidus ATCC BAA-382]|uniref:Homoserine O-acetyltransferase n=1 Tax=Enterococcus haemoperoxidus ATCC BAA-382 TaxID=1158608 RepID=R2QPY8_9ENTE|nr:homoserine O-succinyltransferase [Enterococcus haemoperoxidus]EOH98572.1 homoserine O-succinyltransferase [Enterococcus haemoperoxidus ATCC BAA-382]EOT62245.1 homoserine O-succinyltransferase [Enterococcus haemoperoxidus ATCC BAA-382]OJG55673.1 homoserine O-succinyltransferase [Enterococcus haemoperoxidus]